MSQNVRFFYRDEIDSNEGVERRVVVAYTHNRETGDTAYGATIFRRPIGDRTQVFEKSAHRQTALQRFLKRPVNLKISGENWNVIEDQIRSALRTNGVKGERVRD